MCIRDRTYPELKYEVEIDYPKGLFGGSKSYFDLYMAEVDFVSNKRTVNNRNPIPRLRVHNTSLAEIIEQKIKESKKYPLTASKIYNSFKDNL